MKEFSSWLVEKTEAILTWRARRKARKKQREAAVRARRNTLLKKLGGLFRELVETVLIVLVIQQYLIQAYVIPSGSMEKTLMIGDRVMVDKLTFGPEILPTVGKLPGLSSPKRGDIVVFENPSYISPGVAFEILHRFIYMMTLSLVDINRDEQGNPRAQLLVKRAVGTAGDRVRLEKGEVFYWFPGEGGWIAERVLLGKGVRFSYRPQRLVSPDMYPLLEKAARAVVWFTEGFTPDLEGRAAYQRIADSNELVDYYAFELYQMGERARLHPEERDYARMWWQGAMGWYIPPGRLLPLGDNRDNSRDGRYFGTVSLRKVLGRPIFRFWPPARIGGVR